MSILHNEITTMDPIAALLSLEFDEPRRWITRKHAKGTPWHVIASCPTSDDLTTFLEQMVNLNDWPKMTEVMWKALVSQQEENELETMALDIRNGHALVIDGSSNSLVEVPESSHSCWQLYKNKLLADGFADKSVGEIERATIKLLKRLSSDTRTIDPVKGLVIGNVQSGKTANMAALMAMAADWGWNMFIILSGTIDNLRIQTQGRLHDDLNSEGCNLSWYCLEHLSTSSPIGSRAQDLHFEEGSRQRYFTVSLKNASRLKKLIQWLQKDRNKMKQMKILVIDDEADQAGINTANVDSAERKRINGLICALANGMDEKSRPVEDKYLAMNYIGYTATPYANILNESSRESLYPKNFISTLTVSKEYFGPQQIFGMPEGDYRGLDIIRNVGSDDLQIIKDIHSGTSNDMPESLSDAICWFICCVAGMRVQGYKKSMSMLVHTSQRVPHHEEVSNLIQNWMNSLDKKELLEMCRTIWERETSLFPLDEFKEQYPDYGLMDKLKDYPVFEEIEDEIERIISVDLKPIHLNEQGVLKYHNGIHLCVDNSANNGVNDEDEYLRLVYPKKENMPEVPPAFLVIGGATLSRGLTLEGLVCTFFLRSVKQADTLMQMGRWFGYRKGYELYPRLWITEAAQSQFEYLAILDHELREEIHMMEVKGLKPNEYAARIRNTPKLQLIRITAKNRMQKSMDAEMDYSGSFNQTYLFDEDADILKKNYDHTERFINGLGAPMEHKDCNPHSANANIWTDVSLDTVESFLKGFKFCERLTVFNDMSPLLAWIRKITEEGNLKNWNVVLAGKKKAEEDELISFENCKVSKITRTRKKTKTEVKNVINIGVLRAPTDILADVDLDGQPDEVKLMFRNIEESRVKEIRSKAGLSTTPQLLIYVVDKDSKAKADSSARKDLNAPCDIVGLCVNIPGGNAGANYVAKVCIKLENEFNDEGDLDGSNS